MQKNLKYSSLPTIDKIKQIADWAQEKKGIDVLGYDLSKQQSLAEAVCIVSATSLRHAQGLADHILEQCSLHKFEKLRMEGYEVAQWILLDLNDIVVHILQTDSRNIYRLDDLWASSPVIMDFRKEK